MLRFDRVVLPARPLRLVPRLPEFESSARRVAIVSSIAVSALVSAASMAPGVSTRRICRSIASSTLNPPKEMQPPAP
jgi:hypothetical protein